MSGKIVLWIISVCVLNCRVADGRIKCGGTLTGTKGLIQTPNFPNEFTVPITCQWIIDATEIATSNSSIIVYFTQLYVLEGLTFEEYETYDPSYRIPGKHVFTVSESNITKVRWILTHQNVLVVTFHLDSIANTHLRILDYLLDVYGFNMTYEITDRSARKDACCMADCGFNGICYDHVNEFSCNCFPGYSGSSCSEGPNSLCFSKGKSRCQNGGTCTHVGANSVKCNCSKGFYGEKCQMRTQQTLYQDCEQCLVSCPVTNKKKLDYNEYSLTVLLPNPINFKPEILLDHLQLQVANLLRWKNFRVDYVRVSNMLKRKFGTELTIICYGSAKDRVQVEDVLSDWFNKNNKNFTSVKRYDYEPIRELAIQSVDINQLGIIREQDEFILSCVAQGSTYMEFKWMKDGQLINITKGTKNKWTRLIQDPRNKDQYTALLGVGKASYLDQGMFTCQVEDDGFRQCLSKKVTVRRPPEVKIEPMSLTVQKGENFTIKCICVSDKNFSSKYTYSWTKNKELLAIKTDTEKYEILFPQGSILQVSRVDRPATYTCLVQDGAVSTEVSIKIDVIDRNRIRTCPGEKHINVLWPETAPGSFSIQECPHGFTGIVRRTCTVQDANKAKWQTPDFSLCTADSLLEIDLNFQKLVMGYETTDCLKILKAYEHFLSKRTSLLPGEGSRIVQFVLDVISYNNISQNVGSSYEMATTVYNICDRLLTFKDSLINETQIVLFQHLIRLQTLLYAPITLKNSPFHYSLNTLDVTVVTASQIFRIPDDDPNKNLLRKEKYPSWYSFKMKATNNFDESQPNTVAVVLYKNLTDFLPGRSVIRLKDGTELEYEIISKVVAAWRFKYDNDYNNWEQFDFTMDFTGHHFPNSSNDNWNINCSAAQFANYGFSWNINACETIIISSTWTRCVCYQAGTFALLITNRPQTAIAEEHSNYRITSLVGCILCFLLCTIAFIILTIYWSIQKSCLIFLKIQCCLSLTGTMAIFIAVLAKELPHKYYSHTVTMLETFILVSLSSQISKFLLVLTELAQFSKTPNIKKTVVAITTGIPIITVFGSHLSHQSMGKKISSWWLIKGTLSFYIFISCFVITIILFLLLYYIVMKKLNAWISQEGTSIKVYIRRKKCLQRSTFIFNSTCLMIICSIVYVNFESSLLCDYAFCLSTVFLGTIIFFCYILKPELTLNQEDCFKKLCTKKKKNVCKNQAIGNSLSIFSKQSPDCENECVPPEIRGQLDYCGESHHQHLCNSMQVSSTFSNRCNDCGPNVSNECSRCRELESYKSSPKKYKNTCGDSGFMTYNPQNTPDVISTRVCVELDLVTPLLNSHNNQSPNPPDQPVILCNIAVNPVSGNPNFQVPYISITEDSSAENAAETAEPKIVVQEETDSEDSTENPISDRLDGMLTKISHDLDYLLNRSADVPAIASGNLRKSSVSISSRMEQIEEEAENPEDATDLLLRTKC